MTRPTGATLRDFGHLLHRKTSDLLSVGLDPEADVVLAIPEQSTGLHFTHPEPPPAPTSIDIRCPGCRFGTAVATRDQFAILEELHTVACDVDHLAIEVGSIDDILALPPHNYDQAWDTGWIESQTG